MEATTVGSEKTQLPPCAVQIHPHDDSFALVGTYKLNEETRTRHGSIDIFDISTAQPKLLSSHKTESSVLDIQLYPHDPSILVSAQSTGSIIVWKLHVDEQTLVRIGEYQLFDESTLVLSLAFSLELKCQLSATLTTGEVALLSFREGAVELINTSAAHMDQAWISSFGSGSLSNVLFSGADDCKLVAHDTRTFGEGNIWSKMLHDAGVTSILPSSSKWMAEQPFTLWTGGYDDNLRSIDLRTENSLEPYHIPRVKSSLDLGGGVWRLIPSPVADNRVLACCMYGGARILTPGEPATVVKTYTNHDSMVYGGAWKHNGEAALTCSFYDNQLRMWATSEEVPKHIN